MLAANQLRHRPLVARVDEAPQKGDRDCLDLGLDQRGHGLPRLVEVQRDDHRALVVSALRHPPDKVARDDRIGLLQPGEVGQLRGVQPGSLLDGPADD